VALLILTALFQENPDCIKHNHMEKILLTSIGDALEKKKHLEYDGEDMRKPTSGET
jgi:hypothetical protein